VLQTTEAAARARLDTAARLLETLSHRATLARGYAVVRDRAAHVVTGVVEAAEARALEIEFGDGRIDVSAGEPAAPAPRPKQPSRSASPADRQGVLL
jgi:exodeoxyribonuclease VII large subunit